MEAVPPTANTLSGQDAPLDSANLIALLLIVETALLSHITVAILLIYVLCNAIRNRIRRPSGHGRPPWRFIRTATDYYFFNLFFMDLIQSLGSILDVRWIHNGHVDADSTYCSAQGFIKQFGNVGVALSTLVITIHTFAVLFLRWRVPDTKWLPLGVIGLVWLFLILATSIPWATKKDYYSQTGSWCWINEQYPKLQYGLEYDIVWIVAFSGIILYTPLFFRLRRTVRSYPEHRRQQMQIARQLLVYPIAYIIIITPISVVRKIQFTNSQKMAAPGQATSQQPPVAPALVGFSGVVFALSGCVDATLYVITRPSILRSFLSLFQSNESDLIPLSAGFGSSEPANGRRRQRPSSATVPEVTVLSQSDEEQDLAYLGNHHGGVTGRRETRETHRPRRDSTRSGLPRPTRLPSIYLTPGSLLIRGPVAESESGDYRRGTPAPQILEGGSNDISTDSRELLFQQNRNIGTSW